MQCTEAGFVIALRRRVELTRIPHERKERLSEIGINYGFFGRGQRRCAAKSCVSSVGTVQLDAWEQQLLTGRERQITRVFFFLTAIIKSLGFKRILVRSDNERPLLSLIERVT